MIGCILVALAAALIIAAACFAAGWFSFARYVRDRSTHRKF
jgi:hypothetical protein